MQCNIFSPNLLNINKANSINNFMQTIKKIYKNEQYNMNMKIQETMCTKLREKTNKKIGWKGKNQTNF